MRDAHLTDRHKAEAVALLDDKDAGTANPLKILGPRIVALGDIS